MELLIRAMLSSALTFPPLSLAWDATALLFSQSITVARLLSPDITCLSSLLLCIPVVLLLLILKFLTLRRTISRLQTKAAPMEGDNSSQKIKICCSQAPDQVFILSGQSNMSGRGGVHTKHYKDGSAHLEWDHVVPPECNAEKGKIWCLNAKLDWVEAHEPMHQDIDKGKVCGLGPGLVFSATLLQRWKGLKESAPSIGLVPCAIGGTQIKQWEKGSKLYDQMIHRAKNASADPGAIKAVMWYQGESDTYSAQNVKEFPARLETLFTNIRHDLQNDELPIIQVGITAKDHPHPELLNEIRCAQMAVTLPGVYYVDADGLPLLDDNIHLNMHSQVQLGKWLADTYLNSVQDFEEDTHSPK